MTLKHLRWLAVIAPIALVLLLEYVRSSTVGAASMRSRILLDGVAAAILVLVSVLTVRAIARMQRRLVRHNEELLALHGAGLDVSAELSLDVVLNKVVERARTLVGSRYGALSVVKADGTIQNFLTSGVSPEERARIGPPPTGHGLLGVVLREGERLRLPDIGRDPRSYGFPPNHPMMHSLLAVPVICKGPFAGNLYLSEKEHGAQFTAGDEETLERFAVQAAIAIDNAYLHRQVADLAVAQERLHIAHEMHDGIAQVLGYVNTKVQAANAYLSQGKSDEAGAQLNELALAARDAYGDLRESLVNLRTLPSAERMVSSVLEEYLDRWKAASGVSTQLTIDPDLRIPPGIELQLIRIVQEALTNVRKHAAAARVELRLAYEPAGTRLTVEDFESGQNGRAEAGGSGYGLTGMRERAELLGGTLTAGRTSDGFRVELWVPR